jgi:hypothetical protein
MEARLAETEQRQRQEAEVVEKQTPNKARAGQIEGKADDSVPRLLFKGRAREVHFGLTAAPPTSLHDERG